MDKGLLSRPVTPYTLHQKIFWGWRTVFSLRRGAFVVVGVCAAVLALQAPSGATVVSSAPLASPAPAFNLRVRSIVHSGSVIYVGGDFTNVTVDSIKYPRNHVAAIDPETGALLPWNPNTNGDVYTLAVDRGGVYLGGSFSSVGGVAVKNLARVNGTTGALDRRVHHKFNNIVRTVSLSSNRVYVGGDFTQLGTSTRLHLAAFQRFSPFRLTGWAPRAAHGVVNVVKVARRAVYVGGGFTKLNGQSTYRYLARVDRSFGALSGSFKTSSRYPVFGVALTPYRVYAAAGGPGGHVYAKRRSTGHGIWHRTFDGDVQAVAVLDGTVYVGGHFEHVCSTDRTGPYGHCLDAGAAYRMKLAAFGTMGGLSTWDPHADSGVGVTTLDPFPGRSWLAVGGTFDTLDNGTVTAHKFAVFAH